MKTKYLPLLAMLLALALSAFATIKDIQKEKHKTLYYWFAVNGTYLGHFQGPPTECPLVMGDACAKGYLTVEDPSDPSQPAGAPAKDARKVH